MFLNTIHASLHRQEIVDRISYTGFKSLRKQLFRSSGKFAVKLPFSPRNTDSDILTVCSLLAETTVIQSVKTRSVLSLLSSFD